MLLAAINSLVKRLRPGGGANVGAQLGTLSVTAVAISAGTFAIRWLVPGHPSQGYALFGTVFALVTLVGGRKAGLFSVALAALEAAYFLLDGEAFAVSDPVDALGLIGLIGSGVVVVCTVGSLRERLRDAGVRQDELKVERAANADLLRELSHRVRNDLHLLTSVASMQAMRAQQTETRDALTGLTNRIQILGSLYQRLDSNELSAALDMPAFLGGLCHDTRVSQIGLRPIALRFDSIPCRMARSRAQLVGLILNEALANVLKYAFAGEQPGTITVDLGPDPRDAAFLQLTVSDDGSGFSPGAAAKGTGMGGRLMRSMAAQLNGEFTLERSGGLTIARLRFPNGDTVRPDI